MKHPGRTVVAGWSWSTVGRLLGAMLIGLLDFTAAHAADDALAIARQGNFYIGGKYVESNGDHADGGTGVRGVPDSATADPSLSDRHDSRRQPDRDRLDQHAGRARGLGDLFSPPRLCGLCRRPGCARTVGLYRRCVWGAPLADARIRDAEILHQREIQSVAAGQVSYPVAGQRASRAIRPSTTISPPMFLRWTTAKCSRA